MTPLVFVVAVAITAVVSTIIVRALAGRQLAETRGALAAQLAAIEQDNKWLRDEVERHKRSVGATQELLDKAEGGRLFGNLKGTYSNKLSDYPNLRAYTPISPERFKQLNRIAEDLFIRK